MGTPVNLLSALSIGRKVRDWTEKMVDRWLAEDESDFEVYIDKWSTRLAIIACVATCGYILIPAFAGLWGLW